LFFYAGQRPHEGGLQWRGKTSFHLSIHVLELILSVGRPKYQVVIPNTANQLDSYIGEELTTSKRGLYKLKHPLSHGVIEHWDDMELLWKHAFSLLKIAPN
jgi:actin-related protein